jgi:hypothetical protein
MEPWPGGADNEVHVASRGEGAMSSSALHTSYVPAPGCWPTHSFTWALGAPPKSKCQALCVDSIHPHLRVSSPSPEPRSRSQSGTRTFLPPTRLGFCSTRPLSINSSSASPPSFPRLSGRFCQVAAPHLCLARICDHRRCCCGCAQRLAFRLPARGVGLLRLAACKWRLAFPHLCSR